RQGIRRARQETVRHRVSCLFLGRQGVQEALLDLRRRRGCDRRRPQGRDRRPAAAPRRHARRPPGRALCRPDQELCRPTGGLLEVIKDTTEYEAAAAGAQRDLILGTIAILAAAVLLAFLLGRGLSRPLTAITAVMNRLARGETGIAIPGSERRD